ncbi:MAG: anthranilate synthase component I [Actinobacteria bacterium]|nr:anthranilate synthase component I [Actinomycetota bacterium]MCG2819114.1 anthranilate synthase component I [Actinomycetes bacterium]MBU4178360.1 anthranilate synthase component I [Actinomycetota bacterium]MBU4218721.1 anthranilate synthase component I [Actinomycetota bacterium]MBU4359450.1 anthranilate synthase component I [Actinomycetota bacterium]
MSERTVSRVSDRETGLAVSPGRQEFLSLAGAYDLAMVTTEMSCDLETPISTFIKLKGDRPCFLLESAERGRSWGRYSILGFNPARTVRTMDGSLLVSDGRGEKKLPGNPVENLFRLVDGSRVFLPDESAPFGGGAVGYFAYDVIPYIEKVALSGEATGLPEMMFIFPRQVVVFDHLRSRVLLGVLSEVPGDPDEGARSHREAADELAMMVARLETPLPAGLGQAIGRPGGSDFSGACCNMSRESYEQAVEEAREHIMAGDAFQIVISQRFTLPFQGDPLAIYRFLRSENPSPYMFYLELPEMCLVGSSPEPMVTNRGGTAVIKPIAGTRPRGADEQEDARLAGELKEDPKERAEHVMLVDLARNDLGRVCRAGTVEVTSLMEVEMYSHVMHMVSRVEGELKEGMGNHELFKASFPAGTVSGAPKVRACQIIDEMETERRGPYAGAVGYLSYTGDMDTCIAIRTVVVEGGKAWVQAGAGIVADSVPSREWEETRSKARALIRAVKAAGGEGP